MRFHRLTTTELLKAIGIGIGTAVLLSAVMVPALRLGVSPLPKPLGLAFAETILGAPLPLPVGLLFHVAYVTIWAVVYVVLFRHALTFSNALLLGLVLWVIVLLVFFPVVGWGFLGLAVGPQLIVASLVPHLLFAVFLWSLCRASFRQTRATAVGRS
ncbi:MAG TPA: hypothetical protein VE592_11335 [Geminicoccaceae bacterium]|jgi:hypothetical protein|nr:hypothetical protein [Geminicoccaceae bacterium]